jgi:hypothetical protein
MPNSTVPAVSLNNKDLYFSLERDVESNTDLNRRDLSKSLLVSDHTKGTVLYDVMFWKVLPNRVSHNQRKRRLVEEQSNKHFYHAYAD